MVENNILKMENKKLLKYVTSKKAMEQLGVSIVTLRTWASNNLIDTIRTAGNHRMYNVDKYLNECINQHNISNNKDDLIKDSCKKLNNNKDDIDEDIDNKNDKDNDNDNDEEIDEEIDNKTDEEIDDKDKTQYCNICYIRVSTDDEIDFLNKQKIYMEKKYPQYKIINDIGSGLDYNRKGFKKIINLAIQKKLKKLVIMDKNRFVTNGFDLIEKMLYSLSNTKIIIENKDNFVSKYDIMTDMSQLLNTHNYNYK